MTNDGVYNQLELVRVRHNSLTTLGLNMTHRIDARELERLWKATNIPFYGTTPDNRKVIIMGDYKGTWISVLLDKDDNQIGSEMLDSVRVKVGRKYRSVTCSELYDE